MTELTQNKFDELICTVSRLTDRICHHGKPELNPGIAYKYDKKVLWIYIHTGLYHDIQIHCYDYKKKDMIFILKFGSNLKAYTVDEIKNGVISTDFISRFRTWLDIYQVKIK